MLNSASIWLLFVSVVLIVGCIQSVSAQDSTSPFASKTSLLSPIDWKAGVQVPSGGKSYQIEEYNCAPRAFPVPNFYEDERGGILESTVRSYSQDAKLVFYIIERHWMLIAGLLVFFYRRKLIAEYERLRSTPAPVIPPAK